MTGTTEHDEWKHYRLPNWGRSQWAALMADAPDSSCANPIYDMGPAGDPDGYADDADTAAAPRAAVVIELTTRQELPPVVNAWWTTDERTVNQGAALGLSPRAGETMANFRDRIAAKMRGAA